MKKMIAVLLSLALCLSVSGALADTLTMGTNAEFAPFEFVDDNGEIAGFDVELVKAIAENLGMELKIEDMYFDGLLGALSSNMVDVVVAAMTINEERLAQVDFTAPYFTATQAVVVLEGNESIKSLEDLAGKKAAVQDGTTGFFMASDELGCDVSDTVYKFSSDAALDVVNGRADCMIIDDAVAQNFLKLYDNLVLVEGLDMPTEEYGMAVVKGNAELLEKLNGAIEALKADGTYDALIEKYFVAAE